MMQIINKLGSIAPEIVEDIANGSTAINETIAPIGDFRLISIHITSASSIADDITVTLDSANG